MKDNKIMESSGYDTLDDSIPNRTWHFEYSDDLNTYISYPSTGIKKQFHSTRKAQPLSTTLIKDTQFDNKLVIECENNVIIKFG
jgi:hypothetical protein